MKILLAAAGYPPEFEGETELEVQALARALAAGGNEVRVVAGTLAPAAEPGVAVSSDGEISVHRIQRADLHIEHWQKSGSAPVARLFREIVRRDRPEVVHVHHWRRLARDLVQCAALEGLPCVVTLHDHWTTCLIASRVRPESGATCEAELGASPCLACAQRVPPKTPWVPIEAQHMAFAERARDLARELTLARAVLVPSPEHAAALKRFWPAVAGRIGFTVIAPFRASLASRRARPGNLLAADAPAMIERWLAIYARARSEGPPELSPAGVNAWYRERMLEFAQAEWDRSLSRCTPRELGNADS